MYPPTQLQTMIVSHNPINMFSEKYLYVIYIYITYITHNYITMFFSLSPPSKVRYHLCLHLKIQRHHSNDSDASGKWPPFRQAFRWVWLGWIWLGLVGWLDGWVGFGVLGHLGHLDFPNFAQLYIQKNL